MRKSKLIFTIIGMFLLLGTINVKAYDVSSLTGSNYTVTIDKFQMNLYPAVERTGNTISMFKDPITFELPIGVDQFTITGDNLVDKQLKYGENKYLKLKLIKLENNFTEERLGEFLETQTFDKTKKYYGDIEVKYTVSAYPDIYKTFTQINGLRTGLSLLDDASAETLGIELEEGTNLFDFGKTPYVTQNLTSGTSFSSTQTLNMFFYNYNDDDGDTAEALDKFDYTESYAGGAVDEGIYAFDYGLISENTTFDITKVSANDEGIMFSIVDGMSEYVDSISMATIGDDYVGDIIDDGDDILGTQIVKVGNTAATQNELLIVTGLILVFSGLLLFYNVFRKRYN